LAVICASRPPGAKGGATQFFGQFGNVHGAQAGIEILWFVKLLEKAPTGGREQPALFPERCTKPASCPDPPPSSPIAASLAIPALASLDGTPVVGPPLEAPPAPLAAPAPLAVLVSDPADEFEPAVAPPLAIPELEDAIELPLPKAAAPAPLAALPLPATCSMPGLVWLALLHAAASKTAQPSACPADLRLTVREWRLGRASIND
jgi:hypothetical protein